MANTRLSKRNRDRLSGVRSQKVRRFSSGRPRRRDGTDEDLRWEHRSIMKRKTSGIA